MSTLVTLQMQGQVSEDVGTEAYERNRDELMAFLTAFGWTVTIESEEPVNE